MKTKRSIPIMTVVQRRKFWARVNVNGPIPKHRPELGNCWLWMGCKSKDGYGVVAFGKQSYGAHRVAYKDQIGNVAKSEELDHVCRNRPCCRPSHCEPVSSSINVRRGKGKDNAAKFQTAKTHCPKGHEYTEENTAKYAGGGRRCRECHRAESRKRYQDK